MTRFNQPLGPASSRRRARTWSLANLEPRQMLAADVGVAVAESVESSAPAGEVDSTVNPTAHLDTTTHLVIVDSAVASAGEWASSLPEKAELVVLADDQDAFRQIAAILESRTGLESIHVISHGRSGELSLAGQQIDQTQLESRADEIAKWKTSLADGADLLLYGCNVAEGRRGEAFISTLRGIVGVDVAASVDRTGAKQHTGDWDLEVQMGQVEFAALLDRDALARFQGYLQIEIWAAGQTGDELMELEINGEVVDTWFVRDTNAATGNFLPYYYNVDGISADDIRINFVNDAFDPSTGLDRNLRVDRIVVDGVTFQTESPWVYSQGVFVDGLGVTEGSFNTEYLVANGYMQFHSSGFDTTGGNPGGGNGSFIEIEAAGDTGDETMQLLVDGNVVASYFNVSRNETTYSFQSDQTLTADRVRVAFVNSIYDPGENYDQNLRVDRILIDGQSFETEDSSTFSTGTYVSGQGIVSGNWQSEYLHGDGYFQYNGTGGPVDPGGDAGSFSLVTSDVTAVESAGTLTFEVRRVGGSSGSATVDIFTAGETAGAGQDFVETADRLFFADGETSKTFTVDLIDDGVGEATEQFTVRLDNPVGADLLAPRTSLVTILDDDSGLPRYTTFDSASGLNLNGSASLVGGQLELTSTATRQAGTAFYESPISVSATTSFQSQFAFTIGGGQGSAGADGMTFLLQNSGQGADALGRAGGYLGYDTIGNSVAVEFDNYNNGGDIQANTIAVVLNGDTRNAIAEVAAPFDLNNGTTYHAWVDYNGNSNNLAVFISTTSEKPNFAVLKTNIALEQIVGNSAYAGFSAGNFDLANFHRVSSWNFSLDAPPADPPLNPTGDVVEQDVYSGLNQPLALDWSPDGRNIYIAEKAGVIKVARDGSTNPSVLLDISAQVNDVQDRGLVDFVLDPNFQSNGYIYLAFTYDPPQVFDNVGNANAGPDGRGNRAARVVRYTADASTGFTTIVSGSEKILLGTNSTWENINPFVDSTVNLSEPQAGYDPQTGYLRDFINSDSRSHTIGSLAFANDGSLFVSTGDGASFNNTDTRALRVQSFFSLSGKVLRIDPETGQGLSDNPFYDGDPDSNRSKIYQLGLRNPWRLTYDEVNDQLFIGETGLGRFEEINTGSAGTNFGWPYYEGAQGVNSPTPGYSNLPQAQNFYQNGSAKPATIALAHQAGSNVVVLGDIVTNGDLGLQYEGDLFYNDLYRGVVRHANVGPNGQLTGVQTFATGAEFVVDIQQGPDGSLYYANLLEGTVGRWQIV